MYRAQFLGSVAGNNICQIAEDLKANFRHKCVMKIVGAVFFLNIKTLTFGGLGKIRVDFQTFQHNFLWL